MLGPRLIILLVAAPFWGREVASLFGRQDTVVQAYFSTSTMVALGDKSGAYEGLRFSVGLGRVRELARLSSSRYVHSGC